MPWTNKIKEVKRIESIGESVSIFNNGSSKS